MIEMKFNYTKLINFHVDYMENAGCNNGNYPTWTAETINGKPIGGIVCRCRNGCSGTDRVVESNGEYFLEQPEEE